MSLYTILILVMVSKIEVSSVGDFSSINNFLSKDYVIQLLNIFNTALLPQPIGLP